VLIRDKKSSQGEINLSNYDWGIFDSEKIVVDLFKDAFEAFTQVLATWEGFEDILPKVLRFEKSIQSIGKKCYTANEPGHGYNVLNHADFHPRNTLMKMNAENRVESFYFVSFDAI
jgi:ASC-1-like (ASCH) protein